MPLVVVDPGHGGTDPGTVGNGLQEKNITLDAALRLRDALTRCGIRVIMTRTTDSLVLPNGTISQDLSQRAAIANNNHADLFISWHVDSSSSPDVNGVATWIYPSAKGTSTQTIAQNIVDAIALATGQKNRGVYFGDFAVLRETTMDAVLIESGFITNAQEAANLAQASFRAKQAEAVAKAVCNWFKLPYVPPYTTATTPTQPTAIASASTPSTPPPVSTISAPTIQGYSDSSQWPDWAKNDIETVLKWGVMQGFPDGTFRPNETTTRAELAVALVRLEQFIMKGGA